VTIRLDHLLMAVFAIAVGVLALVLGLPRLLHHNPETAIQPKMAPAAHAARTPGPVRTAMLKAARAKHSVHYVVDLQPKSTYARRQRKRIRMVGDVAAGRGIQRITVSRIGATGHVTVLVVNGTAYIRGDAYGLNAALGFTLPQADALNGRWIAVPRTSRAYKAVAADVTFSSFVGHVVPKRGLSLVEGGAKMIGVHGTVVELGHRFPETTYAATSGNRLPIEIKAIFPGLHGGLARITMSDWNEPVRVSAPANALQPH
jgi:hypothetical protein